MLSTALFTAVSIMAAMIAGLAVFAAVRKLEAADELHRDLERDLRALAVLRLDVDSLDTRLRRLAGSVYSPPGSRRKPVAAVTDDDPYERQADLNGLDPELAAELALQRAPAASPGKS